MTVLADGTSTTDVVLDTDIGSDVDDALALALVLGSPRLRLRAVTTVYGDTHLRARLTKRLLSLAGRHDVPVIAGAAQPLSGRAVWWAGHEASGFDDLDAEAVDGADAPARLRDQYRSTTGAETLLAIGPLTNVALSMTGAGSNGAGRSGPLYVMGGDLSDPPLAEHNLLSDVTAARRVLQSSRPTTVVGLDVTTRVRLTAGDVEVIRGSGPFGAALGRAIDQWWAFNGQAWNNPHDPVTVLALTDPDLFESVRGSLSVQDDGRVHFERDDAGTTTAVIGVDAEAARHRMVERIAAVQG